MKIKMLITTVVTLACACTVMAAGDGPIQERKQVRDQLKICTPDLEQDQCLPEEVKEAVKDMTQAREKYQQQLKDTTDCAAEDCEQLRVRLREQIKDQTCDREQLRERLQEMRDCLPTHDELMEQAKEQTRDCTRIGEE